MSFSLYAFIEMYTLCLKHDLTVAVGGLVWHSVHIRQAVDCNKQVSNLGGPWENNCNDTLKQT